MADRMMANIVVSVSPEHAVLAYMKSSGDGDYVVCVNGGHPVKVVKVPKAVNIQDILETAVAVGGLVPEGAGETVVEAQPAAGEPLVRARGKWKK